MSIFFILGISLIQKPTRLRDVPHSLNEGVKRGDDPALPLRLSHLGA